jgi:dUTP pyrophosphatase
MIMHGDRIAQMVVHKVEKIKWKQVKKISATQRGDGGFGHTGKK